MRIYVRPPSRTVKTTIPRNRFREARERAGLMPDEVATRSGVKASVWDIEAFDEDLAICYSPRELQRLCAVIGISVLDLFSDDVPEPAVSAAELMRLIRDECRVRGVTLEQFEEVVGWALGPGLERPEWLLEEGTLDGLKSICEGVHTDWLRVLKGL